MCGNLISAGANQIWIECARGSGFVRFRYEEPIAYSRSRSEKAKTLPSARYGYGVWRKTCSFGSPPFCSQHDLSLQFSAFGSHCSFSLLCVLCSGTVQCLNECKLPVNTLRRVELRWPFTRNLQVIQNCSMYICIGYVGLSINYLPE